MSLNEAGAAGAAGSAKRRKVAKKKKKKKEKAPPVYLELKHLQEHLLPLLPPEKIATLPSGSTLVNIARGPVVDTAALTVDTAALIDGSVHFVSVHRCQS